MILNPNTNNNNTDDNTSLVNLFVACTTDIKTSIACDEDSENLEVCSNNNNNDSVLDCKSSSVDDDIDEHSTGTMMT